MMEKRLQECLNNQPDSYILPFFWQHGEDHSTLKREIDAIQNSGVSEFCVESRTHEDFCQEKWWIDFQFILEEAKSRTMKVWLLDDKNFPTGYANGALVHQNESHRKKSIREAHVDVSGAKPNAALLVKPYDSNTEELLFVLAYKRTGIGEELYPNPIDLTENVADGLVYFDIPEGTWRIFFLYKTQASPEHFKYYIDMLSADSCKILLNTVYIPHYEHFSDYFGNTFAGFFSDEPCFGNNIGSYYDKLGKKDLLLPWRDDLPQLIAEACEKKESEIIALLPALWFDIAENTSLLRYYYMDAISKLYSKNFSSLLGDWCRAHHVLYIGHVIEDLNTHMRTGYGSGHFYRALDGQDMAGIDVVLHQIVPGITEEIHTAPIAGGLSDPEFFTYALAKLASSHSHIQPLKKNRAMCEMFGAYGWAEGLPMMKQLTDHMLVNGINYFVPHAFSPKYPDYDCPPHFYAQGKNPHYNLFGTLMQYTQRMSHILSGGVHQANIAVYYNAEAEWSGGDYMLFQKIAKVLTQHQIDFDFLPLDTILSEKTTVVNGKLCVNQEKYDAILISQSEYLPYRLLEAFYTYSNLGVYVGFADKLPRCSSENKDIAPFRKSYHVCPLDEIPTLLFSLGYYDIKVDTPCKNLRYYHIVRDTCDLYMFYNEDIYHAIDTTIRLKNSGEYGIYDAYDNQLFKNETVNGKLHLQLAGGQATVLLFGDALDGTIPKQNNCKLDTQKLDATFDIAIKQAGETEYTPYLSNCALVNLTDKNHLPRFSGSIRYTCHYTASKSYQYLDCGVVGETAELYINSEYCGARITSPYKFNIENKLVVGENTIVIEVVNNLAYQERDSFSSFLSLPPSGLLGDITLESYQTAN